MEGRKASQTRLLELRGKEWLAAKRFRHQGRGQTPERGREACDGHPFDGDEHAHDEEQRDRQRRAGNPISYIDSDGLAKKGAGRGGRDKGKGPGGYRGIGTGGLNSKSDPKDIEQAIKEAKDNNASPAHMKTLQGLLKTAKRNMKRALPLIMMEQLLRDQCEMGIPDACEKYCSINPDQCIVRQPQITSIPTLYGFSFTGSLGPVKEGTVNVGEVEVARERPDRENGRSERWRVPSFRIWTGRTWSHTSCSDGKRAPTQKTWTGSMSARLRARAGSGLHQATCIRNPTDAQA